MLLQRVVLFSALLVAVPTGACGLSVDGGGEVAEPAVEAPDMNAFWAAHAADRQRGDLDAATSILAEDCVLYEPFRPPVSGFDSIAAKMKQALSMAEIHDVSFESREVYHQNGRLVDFGTFSETFSLSGDAERHVVEGNYVAALERDADGKWKVKRFMALPSTPPPGVAERTPGASAEGDR